MAGNSKSRKRLQAILAEYRLERGDKEADYLLAQLEALRQEWGDVDLEGLFASVLEMSKTKTSEEIQRHFEKSFERFMRRTFRNWQIMDDAERTDAEAPNRN
jgi:hypothetical protein